MFNITIYQFNQISPEIQCPRYLYDLTTFRNVLPIYII